MITSSTLYSMLGDKFRAAMEDFTYRDMPSDCGFHIFDELTTWIFEIQEEAFAAWTVGYRTGPRMARTRLFRGASQARAKLQRLF